jgi:hypothetical protein
MRWRINRWWNAAPPLGRTVASVCLMLAAVALLLRALGASWVNVAFAVVPSAAAFVWLAIEPRVHGLTRPKPKLTLGVEGSTADGRSVAHGFPPWPLAVQRIVDNEAAEALDSLRVDATTLPTIAIGLASRPTPEDHQRAKEEFVSEVTAYRQRLSEWLDGYIRAACARWETFEVVLTVTNAPGKAHAQAVEVVLELPDTLTQAAPATTIEAPPERPWYVPPKPRRLFDVPVAGGSSFPRSTLRRSPALNLDALIPGRRRKGWEEAAGGRSLTAPKLDVQPGRTVELAEPLLLRARGPGVHEIHWTAYSPSLAYPVSGSFSLVVPENDPQRPPFGRLEGVLRYPDVPVALAGSDGQEGSRELRDSDPPLAPPRMKGDAAEEDVRTKLRGARARREWETLGLDPELDGPSSRRVRIGESSPHA